MDIQQLRDQLSDVVHSNPIDNKDIIIDKILEYRKVTLSQDKYDVFLHFIDFAHKPYQTKSIFIINGRAGTGKTLLISFMLDYIRLLDASFGFFATTGKAAANCHIITNYECSTVHRRLYQFKIKFYVSNVHSKKHKHRSSLSIQYKEITRINPEFSNFNFIIIDEASMLSDDPIKLNANSQNATYINCSGFTLRDVILYSAPDAKIILVGDKFQLPPIGQDQSFAFDPEYIKEKYAIPNIFYFELTNVSRYHVSALKEVVKDILSYIQSRNVYNISYKSILLKHQHYKDGSKIEYVPDLSSFLDKYCELFLENSLYAYHYLVAIAYRNEHAYTLNSFIRNKLNMVSLISNGDVLIATQNNYYYNIMNGQTFLVEEIVENKTEYLSVLINGQPRKVEVNFFHVIARLGGAKKDVSIVLDTAYTIDNMDYSISYLLRLDFYYRYRYLFQAINYRLNNVKQLDQIFFQSDSTFLDDVINDMEFDVNNNTNFDNHKIKNIFNIVYDKEKLKELNIQELTNILSVLLAVDKKLNSLIVNYGYVITCHKSQGGEWKHVFIVEYPSSFSINNLRWLYTAVTRSTECLYYCDIPKQLPKLSHNKSIQIITNNYTGYIPDIIRYESKDKNIFLIDIFDNIYQISYDRASKLIEKNILSYPLGIFINDGKIDIIKETAV